MYDNKAEPDNVLKEKPDNVLEKDGSYFPESEENARYLIGQTELYDLVWDLHLSKKDAELLGSRLQQWNLLSTGTKVTIRQSDNKMCVCVS